jgi:hypothetical protein
MLLKDEIATPDETGSAMTVVSLRKNPGPGFGDILSFEFKMLIYIDVES